MIRDRLWAPWRREYHASPKPRGCIFCSAWRAGDGRLQHVVYRARHVFALLNHYPYNAGHLMVATRRHVGSLTSLSEPEAQELMAVTRRMVKRLTTLLSPQGFNVGLNLGRAGGAGIPKHLHMHVVPRWVGDTNFMPVLGGTRVIPESLDALYARLIRVKS